MFNVKDKDGNLVGTFEDEGQALRKASFLGGTVERTHSYPHQEPPSKPEPPVEP